MYNEDTKIRQNRKSDIKSVPILDTLAQLPPRATDKGFKTINDLKKRARSKWYTNSVVSKLKYLPDTKLKKYYSHAWNCNCKLYQDGKKLSSRWCNTRVCHMCNTLRTAKLMNGYISQFKELALLQFVTLTRKNCTKEELNDVVQDMLKKASLIIRYIREHLGIDINGIRKLEITYNATTDTYHPHFHFLVDNNTGQILVDEWLKRNEGIAQREGYDYKKKKMVSLQDIRTADKNCLNEIFKYTTKIATHKKGELVYYLNALNTIMEAMYKKRSFQTFGKIKKVNEEINEEELNAQEYIDLKDTEGMIIEWYWMEDDWYNLDMECLTGYKPPNIKIEYNE